MKYVVSFLVTVPDGTDDKRVKDYMSDAISLGSEQLDEDRGTALDGFISSARVRKI